MIKIKKLLSETDRTFNGRTQYVSGKCFTNFLVLKSSVKVFTWTRRSKLRFRSLMSSVDLMT